VSVALFLVQTISEIGEENEVQVEDESDFNVYLSDPAMSSSLIHIFSKSRWTALAKMNVARCDFA
jgi:hypothetical protein